MVPNWSKIYGISELTGRTSGSTTWFACAKLTFGKGRVRGSHHIFKTPWQGDPRINLQMVKGKAKPYQVDQVVRALRRLAEDGHG